jgi:hypothetical protein
MPSDARMDSLHKFGISILSPGDRFDPMTNEIRVASKRQRLSSDGIPINWPAVQGIKYTFATTPATADYSAAGPKRIETTLNRVVSVDPL